MGGFDVVERIGLKPLSLSPSAEDSKPRNVGATHMTKQFGTFLQDALNQVNDRQLTVDKLNRQFASGELTDVHKLLIATEKASLGLELTVQIRNKAIEAYQEIMRTQI
jgi:flagellar hook-basal body complex protein FliE